MQKATCFLTDRRSLTFLTGVLLLLAWAQPASAVSATGGTVITTKGDGNC
ncbi:MAG: hypothetical protein WCR06_05070 [bacterium]